MAKQGITGGRKVELHFDTRSASAAEMTKVKKSMFNAFKKDGCISEFASVMSGGDTDKYDEIFDLLQDQDDFVEIFGDMVKVISP